MPKKHVLIEMRHEPGLEAAAVTAFGLAPFTTAAIDRTITNLLPDIPGITPDLNYPPVPIPSIGAGDRPDSALAMSAPGGLDMATYLVRGTIEEDTSTDFSASISADSRVIAIYADPVIEPCPTCGATPAVGNHGDVARLLCTGALGSRGMNGAGTLLAIVDTGINLAYLRSRGLNPTTSVARSWVPAMPPGTPPLVPFELPKDHGTMCAFDALIAAPAATLVDIAVLRSRRTGGSAMDGLLSDAVLAYSYLVRILSGPRRPGDFQSLVVSNSWGIFNRSWDFSPGHPGNYSDNPNHPFNRIVGTLERSGADILFAAGNCGSECPDGRCGAEANAGIFGANSHPQAISVAGVDIHNQRVGYSTRGPGHLTPRKPDLAAYTHFLGSGVYPADGGTSAATPVLAGVVAALRSRFPLSPSRPPAAIRRLLAETALRPVGAGFTNELGWGIVNACKLASVSRFNLPPGEFDPAPDRGAAGDNDQPAGPEIEVEFLPENTLNPEVNMSDQQFLEALRAFELQPAAESLDAAITTSAAAVDICGTYKKVRPILSGILPFLKAIPVFGAKAATAIQALMAALDVVCPQAGPAAGFTAGIQLASQQDAEFLHALAAFDAPPTDFARMGISVTAAPSLGDICAIYKKVKPILNGILPFLGLIPVVGAPTAAAIRALMLVLDTLCP